MLPVQLLWINMSTAVLLGLMLVFEPNESDLMSRPPRPPRLPLLTMPLLMRTGLVTLVTASGAYWLFFYESGLVGGVLAEVRTAVVNVVVFAQMAYLFNCRSLSRSLVRIGLFTNPWAIWGVLAMIAAQLLFTHLPLMNQLFHSAPLSPEAWLRIGGVALCVLVAVEIEKWVRFGGGRGRNRNPE